MATFKFGKYKGQKIEAVLKTSQGVSYVKWLHEQPWFLEGKNTEITTAWLSYYTRKGLYAKEAKAKGLVKCRKR